MQVTLVVLSQTGFIHKLTKSTQLVLPGLWWTQGRQQRMVLIIPILSCHNTNKIVTIPILSCHNTKETHACEKLKGKDVRPGITYKEFGCFTTARRVQVDVNHYKTQIGLPIFTVSSNRITQLKACWYDDGQQGKYQGSRAIQHQPDEHASNRFMLACFFFRNKVSPLYFKGTKHRVGVLLHQVQRILGAPASQTKINRFSQTKSNRFSMQRES
jgi:hypothetical protein